MGCPRIRILHGRGIGVGLPRLSDTVYLASSAGPSEGGSVAVLLS